MVSIGGKPNLETFVNQGEYPYLGDPHTHGKHLGDSPHSKKLVLLEQKIGLVLNFCNLDFSQFKTPISFQSTFKITNLKIHLPL